jgi:hypothetical protein
MRRDRGAVAGIEALPFSFLLFVAAMLFIVNAWAVVDAKLAVSAAAREAARAFVEQDDLAMAHGEAQLAAHETLAAYGRGDFERVTIDQPVLSGPFGRCARVSITVHYRVPALALPWLGGLGDGIEASATHSEAIDAFRSGLDEGGCG